MRFLNPIRLCALVAVLVIGCLAPSVADAKAGHGRHCGRGHAKHSKAVGKSCAAKVKQHGHHTAASDTTSTDPTAPADSSASPAQQCRTEQAGDPAAFSSKYGTNRNQRNAFGKCVESKSADSADTTDGTDDSGDAADDPGADTPDDPSSDTPDDPTND